MNDDPRWKKDGGLAPSVNELDGFNDIVYITEYYVGKKLLNEFRFDDGLSYEKYLEANLDENGLYKPKNSHDNLTMKMCGCIILSLYKSLNKMSWKNVIKGKHPRDIILFSFILGNPIIKFLSRFLLWIPALMMIQSVWKKDKVRPKWLEWDEYEEDGKKKSKLNWDNSRLSWWFRKEYRDAYFIQPIWYKCWNVEGEYKESRHMQNDGKILTKYRLMALKDKSWTMKLTAIICNKLYKRYNENWASYIYDRYFKEEDHPVPLIWHKVREKGINPLD